MLRGGAQADPLVPKTRGDAAVDHRLQHLAVGLIADPVQQLSTRTYLLQSVQVAALVVDTRNTVADKLLGDVGQPIAVALQRLFRRKRFPLAGSVECGSCAIRNAAVQFPV